MSTPPEAYNPSVYATHPNRVAWEVAQNDATHPARGVGTTPGRGAKREGAFRILFGADRQSAGSQTYASTGFNIHCTRRRLTGRSS